MEELRYHYKYPHPAVTTDCVVFGFDGDRLKVLLIERGREPHKGKWAFPGGFLNMDESADEGALRELKEETGLGYADIRQFHTFTTPERDPRERVISVAYYALVRLQDVKGGDDAARAAWFALDDIPPLAFDHENMLRMAVKALRRQAYMEPIGRNILPDKFALKEISLLYTSIFGTDITKEMLNAGVIVPCGDTEGDLYEFGGKRLPD